MALKHIAYTLAIFKAVNHKSTNCLNKLNISQLSPFIQGKMQSSHRLQRELAYLMRNPSEGISCCPKSDDFHNLTATIMGPSGSPYQGGIFYIEIQVSDRYPFEPPRITFQTPVYHPNIDDKGRICMDVLKMPPKGGWKPTITIKNLLDAIQYLLANPNPDDPLIVEIAEEYRLNREKFEQKARSCVLENARNRF